jgi:hypothetical protein
MHDYFLIYGNVNYFKFFLSQINEGGYMHIQIFLHMYICVYIHEKQHRYILLPVEV